MSDFGARLVSLREQQGLTQSSLAQSAGLTTVYVRRMEDGTLHGAPSAPALASLAHVLGTDEDELFVAAGRVPSPFDSGRQPPTSYFVSAVRRLHSQH
jgi:transcriptional regulator with XRE-family HTH domain